MVLSLACVLAESARRHPDAVAVVEEGGRITYGRLWREALAYAGALRELGVAPGDRVALMAPNTASFPRLYYAILATGAVVVPVHLLLTPGEIAFVLRDCGAKALVATAGLAETAAGAAGQAGVQLAVAADTGDDVPAGLDTLARESRPAEGWVPREPLDPAVIIYTSGTTGRPKGAVLSQLNLVMNVTTTAFDTHGLGPDDVVVGALPLFHAYAQTCAMNAAFRVGARLVLQRRFDAAEAIRLMVREGATVFLGVPTMYVALARAAADAEELPALRRGISGGASLPEPVLERFQEAFGTTVYEGYGLSETSPTATVNQAAFGSRPGTVGHPVWGVEAEIADPAERGRIRLLPAGERGEVVVRGPNVFLGYLGLPEETAEVLVDGWFRTGDLGVKDEEGFLRIVDRVKDVIIRGGFNVYPAEVENVLAGHPDIAEAAVIGLPDEERGEEICAVVVPRVRGAGPEEAERLIEWARERLGRHKYPRRVEFVDALPLGPSLKVLKRELRVRFAPSPAAGVPGGAAAPDAGAAAGS
ncbi:long-chain fatty acid--CoA ligase [Streptomyces sp. DSM 44917]|uniref:Long-chain fatty acid--CoA ligase n=1 Tax=Streptomyces boetiae TaxID=3075541 RepID=A0ABU2L9P3_9ACTN|nr:long-chain fatty acid--CoA ligase [Streptomyces sp. DSM 44917]MDT0307928.1 long-chain fatty acid--CoA ligase [Streptomyces sp. DSM 44917]